MARSIVVILSRDEEAFAAKMLEAKRLLGESSGSK